MRNLLMIAGAAALAVSMPALAEKGGKGGGHGGGHAAKSNGGGHGGKSHGGGHGGGAFKPHKAERQAFRGGGGERHAFRGGGDDRRVVRAERAQRHQPRLVRENRREDRRVRRELRAAVETRRFRDDDRRFAAYGGSCPPGLAKKGNGCLPPGQAKKAFRLGERLERSAFVGYAMPAAYRTFYADTPDNYYRYDDSGYIYRVDRRTDLVSGLVPLLGGGFAVGQPMPAGYDVYNVPIQYRDTWYDTDDAYYRYGDNAIYQVDPQSGVIESIVSLLVGDLNVGQALPAGYDVYNVPLEYRDEYADSDDTLYRYADGNIYQVDAQTQMIQAIVEMLV
ncbi:hypothetical protein E2493_18975 [Sphingomonas parva]|uniref:RcnB family protein n=1 Tax=Sphingomonas parva TaxID=2555898 RepID=A0A4Y8ZL24_9SPHN|nr:hypothetical protein [Sphingomonas parva]TFI56674.1 hypothetical protein E2493_18975 [Sphingomonas parva]